MTVLYVLESLGSVTVPAAIPCSSPLSPSNVRDFSLTVVMSAEKLVAEYPEALALHVTLKVHRVSFTSAPSNAYQNVLPPFSSGVSSSTTGFPPLVTVHLYVTAAPVGLVAASAVNVWELPASTYLSALNLGVPVRDGRENVFSSSFFPESICAAASTAKAGV